MSEDSYPEQWRNREFARGYLEIADALVVGRQRSLEILQSFYRHFFPERGQNVVLDLGCGDGILTYELLQVDETLSAILVDGSEEMLNKARERLTGTARIQFIEASFQELASGKIALPRIDLAVSALAIHHLTSEEKSSLFEHIYSRLNPGGGLVNIDTVRSPFPQIEEWHLELWHDAVFERLPGAELKDTLERVSRQYTQREHYAKVDTLESQMKSLSEAGFADVDCFYKQGMFAMYGGRKIN